MICNFPLTLEKFRSNKFVAKIRNTDPLPCAETNARRALKSDYQKNQISCGSVFEVVLAFIEFFFSVDRIPTPFPLSSAFRNWVVYLHIRRSSSNWRKSHSRRGECFPPGHWSKMLRKRKWRGFHPTGPLGPLTGSTLKGSILGAGMVFALRNTHGLPAVATAEGTPPCLLAHQTQFKMWFRSWRNSTWKKRGAPLRSSGSCTSANWSSSASSCPRRGGPRAAALTAWPIAARQLSRKWPSGQRRGTKGNGGGGAQSQGLGVLGEAVVRHVKAGQTWQRGKSYSRVWIVSTCLSFQRCYLS